ncbi:caspase-1-like isoform X2 [Pelobates cultripes]|uniref:Caspase-1-like isoform X2 n=1 Tax=Pelobates cultripes TaxID=61616 RepID=A0AAD1QZ92_PELCU|nr:caspase-1-like isoform X2 [Pelobates cultripes]
MADELQRVRTKLVEKASQALLDGLLDDLLDRAIVSEAEMDDIKQRYPVTRDRCRQMVDTVKRKGDLSSSFLLQKLSERDTILCTELNIKAPKERQSTGPFNIPVPPQRLIAGPPLPSVPPQRQMAGPSWPSETKEEITLCSDEEAEMIIATEDSKMYAVMPRRNRKRLALLICNIQFNFLSERKGAEYDQIGMTKLLQDLGFEVQSFINLTSKMMQEKMKSFANREEHAESDIAMIVVMSHGERDVICGINSKHIEHENGTKENTDLLKIDDIFKTFNNVNCSKLRGKPKIIIVQACRGSEAGRVWASDSTKYGQFESNTMWASDSTNTDASGQFESDTMVQIETDSICFCSTTPDTVSYRDPKRGSLFILSLIEEIKRTAHNIHLEDIFRQVRSSFEGKLQMPTLERNTLTKKVYLLPGY